MIWCLISGVCKELHEEVTSAEELKAIDEAVERTKTGLSAVSSYDCLAEKG